LPKNHAIIPFNDSYQNVDKSFFYKGYQIPFFSDSAIGEILSNGKVSIKSIINYTTVSNPYIPSIKGKLDFVNGVDLREINKAFYHNHVRLHQMCQQYLTYPHNPLISKSDILKLEFQNHIGGFRYPFNETHISRCNNLALLNDGKIINCD